MNAAKKAAPKRMARRAANWVRPYLTKTEVGLLLVAIGAMDDSGNASELLDPSIESAVAELRRWV